MHSAWHPVGVTSFLSHEIHISELKSPRKLSDSQDAFIIVKSQKTGPLCVSERIKSRFYTWMNQEACPGARKRMLTSQLIGLCLRINKSYALCHLLPSTPPRALRKEDAMKMHSLQTSKTDNFLSPSPINWAPEMCKGRRQTVRLDGKDKTEHGRHTGRYTSASRSHSDQGRDCGTGRGTEGRGISRDLPQ